MQLIFCRCCWCYFYAYILVACPQCAHKILQLSYKFQLLIFQFIFALWNRSLSISFDDQMLIIAFRFKIVTEHERTHTHTHAQFQKVMIGLESKIEFGFEFQHTIFDWTIACTHKSTAASITSAIPFWNWLESIFWSQTTHLFFIQMSFHYIRIISQPMMEMGHKFWTHFY